MKTMLIRNGRIIDGTGATPVDGHLLIEGDVISTIIIGREPPAADKVIDAAGLCVAPGFIDMHSHSDWVLPLEDHDIALKCLLEQGVTTIVGGNCGFSPAPVTDRTRRLAGMDHFSLMVDRPLDYHWDTMEAYLEHVENTRPVVNTAHLVGHGSIRFAHADTPRGALPADEMNACLGALKESLDAGACGLSFGLGYDPGMYSPMDELEAFCKVAAEADKLVTVHLKALSRLSPTYPVTYLKAHNVRALKEMIAVAKHTGVRLQVSHLIFVGRRTWPTAGACLEIIEKERQNGLDIMFDAFPYTCGNTTVNVILPYWFLAGLPEKYKSAWARAVLRAELQLGFSLVGFSYRDLQLMDGGAGIFESLNGYFFHEIAAKWKVTPFEAMMRLSEETRGQAVALLHGYSGAPGNEKALEAVLSHDLCLFMTDAITRYGGWPNPAAVGTFPKILGRYVRERRLIGMPEAVRRMTSASADRFRIKDRGVLAAGKKADVVIFDAASIDETPAAGTRPAGRPRGIRDVFINGTQVVENGRYIQSMRAGQVLRV